MIRIQNIPLSLDGDLEQLRQKAARILGVRLGALEELTLVRQSIDARKKQDLHYVYTIEVSLHTGEEQAVERAGKRNVSLVLPKPYVFPEVKRRSPSMPVVVGMGPAGLFAALFLARNGLPCVVLERGQDVDRRTAQVEHFWDSGLLDPSSNVQFGEGGAGTFSDGKLTTGTHDPRISAVIDALVEAGATRLRPILMTTLTTVVSMVPMALALGDSGSTTQGLALVNIGGLTASTILSLLMLPAYYSLMNGGGKKRMIIAD